MTSGIYKLTNFVNGKIYIGQSHNIEKRWRSHKNDKRECAIGRAIRKHGWSNFNCEILIVVDNQTDMDKYEKAIIAYSRCLAPKGYNLLDGGQSNGAIHDDSKAKMSIAKKGIPLSDEHRAAMSRASKGKPKTEEHAARISAALKGRVNGPRSAESIAKQSEVTKGRKMGARSDKHRANLSAALKGRVISDEWKANISAGSKGRKFSPEHKVKMAAARTKWWAERRAQA